MRKPRFIIAAAVIGLAAVLLVPSVLRHHRRAVQRQWRAAAIEEVNRLASDSDWIATRIAALDERPGNDESSRDKWLSERLVLMQNGEWIVCANKCSKEDWNFDDIFVGKASDGKWYYSTFHFCTGMVVLRIQGRPAGLDSFKKQYFLREFSGDADSLLDRTWPLPGQR
jgi:type II secretory pathway pseudopilin PulG